MVIDKALNPDPKRKPEKTIKFASDIDKIKFDVEADIVDQLREAFENEKKPGQSFSDWLNSKDKDYLIRLQLKEGGDADRSFKPSDTGEYKQTNLIDNTPTKKGGDKISFVPYEPVNIGEDILLYYLNA